MKDDDTHTVEKLQGEPRAQRRKFVSSAADAKKIATIGLCLQVLTNMPREQE
jgi:hypothetical protein